MAKTWDQLLTSVKNAFAFVQGDNEFSRSSYDTSATTPAPSGFKMTLDSNLPNAAGWPFHNIHLKNAQSNNNNQTWCWDLWIHLKTGAMYDNFWDDQTLSFNGYKRIHSNRWFAVNEAMSPVLGQSLIWDGVQFTNGVPLSIVVNQPTSIPLTLADHGKVFLNTGTNVTYTAPNGLPIGWFVRFSNNSSTGTTTIVGGGSTAVNAANLGVGIYNKLFPQPGRFPEARLEVKSGSWFSLTGDIDADPPTIAVNAAAGTGATASVVGSLSRHKITLNTGTAPTAGVLCTLTLPVSFSPLAIVMVCPNGTTLPVAVTNITATTYQLTTSVVPSASTAYGFNATI